VAARSGSVNKKLPVTNAKPNHRDAKGQSFWNDEERDECRYCLRPDFQLSAERMKRLPQHRRDHLSLIGVEALPKLSTAQSSASPFS
jgi:hypothetical protein